ncbi:MAG: hypothetical protein ABI838_01775 [Chloroflexota bacterium]
MPYLRAACRATAVAAAPILLSTVAVFAAPSGWLALDGSIRSTTGVVGDWANSGIGGPAGCSAGAVDVGGSGGLFNCGAPGAGSAPPSPPTSSPAAAADASIIAAVFIVDPISSDTTACGGGDPTVIAGGGKNGDAINSYSLTTQSVPAKDDLGNVYAVSHTRADNGHPELYFGAERLVNNGDSHIDFEFLQDRITITSPCSGSFVGHRTEGDLLATVDFTLGGTLAGVTVYQWHCAADPGPQPQDGTVCDPTGVPHYQSIGTPPSISFLVNPATVPCGGWVCRDKITGNSTQVAANDLMEGGIDLQGLPFTGCFNTFLPHTRTAQSFSSTLKDFTGPAGLPSCRDPNSSSTSSGAGGSLAPGSTVTDAATLTSPSGPLTPTGSLSFFLCGPAAVTAAGCPAPNGAQVGAPKILSGGGATSDPTAGTAGLGRYCWRTEYAPDAQSQGVYLTATHTNSTTECFTAAAAPAPTPTPTSNTPGLPNAGAPTRPSPSRLPLILTGLAVLAWLTATTWVWRRR